MTIKMSGKLYDTLKYIVQVGLPALASLYFGLSNLWGWPYAEQIVGTLSCVELFLGSLIGISNYQYKKAQLQEDGEDE